MDLSKLLEFATQLPLWVDALLAVLVALAGVAALTKTPKDDELIAKLKAPLKALSAFLRRK